MTCPRCGAPINAHMQWCSNCGLALRPSGPDPMTGTDGARSGFWETDPTQADRSGPPRRISRPDPRMGPPSAPPPPPGGMTIPPRSGPPSTPANSRPSVPWPADPRTMPPQGAMMPPQGGVMAPRPDIACPISRMPSAPNLLVAGASLQNGRFRVVGPYRPAQQMESRALSPATQWVALDNANRGERIALMELPFGPMVPGMMERARQEIAAHLMRMDARLNVQHVHSSFSERGRQFLVLEYIDGTFLADRVMRSGKLNERAMVNLAGEVLSTLTQIERMSPPLLHGAIAPDAIIILPDGQSVRLLCPSPLLVARSSRSRCKTFRPRCPCTRRPKCSAANTTSARISIAWARRSISR